MELNEARALAVGLVSPPTGEWIDLEEGLGRVLAETIVAERDIPGEPRSRLDGFVCASGDTAGASPQSPLSFPIQKAVLAAGHVVPERVGPGECVRILTGAPVPEGGDTIIAQEEALEREGRLILEKVCRRGHGMTLPGHDVRRGEEVCSRGEILNPTRLALLAALGSVRIPVYRKPRVAVLATGDEVRELGASLDGPWTVCNNSLLLAWLIRLQGGVPVRLGVVRDDPEAIAGTLRGVDAEVVITTGGIGRGDRDFILRVWEMMGIRTLFRELNLSPGKNSALGVKQDQVFLALPGNPWGAQIVFEELARPLLRVRQGVVSAELSIAAVVQAPLRKKAGMVKAVRGTLNLQGDVPSFVPAAGRDRSLFASLRGNFAYTLLESHVVEVPAGSRVQVRLNDFPLLTSPCFGS